MELEDTIKLWEQLQKDFKWDTLYCTVSEFNKYMSDSFNIYSELYIIKSVLQYKREGWSPYLKPHGPIMATINLEDLI